MVGRMDSLRIKLDDGRFALVRHNSDWSGDAFVKWEVRGRHDVESQEAVIPAKVLLALGFAAAHKSITGRLISALEQMAPEEPR